MPRSYIREFSQYNRAYINAEVAFYTVEDGERTETLATLYTASTGSAQAENPQRLGSRGMFLSPVYHEDPIIAVVVSEGQPSHSTGIIRNVEADADRAEAAADSIEAAYASFAEIETARDEAQTAAATAQSAAAGIKWKNSVKAATTADITLSGEQTVDGVALVAGDRCLVKNQLSASENGIYQVSASAWVRTFDLDAWSEIPSASVSVEQGSTQADTSWTCTADQGGTLEATDITWVLFNATKNYTKTETDAKVAAVNVYDVEVLSGFDVEFAAEDIVVGDLIPILYDRSVVLEDIALYVVTAPTGDALQFDLKLNGGASIFSTKPEIDAASTTDDGNHVLTTTSLSAGDRLTPSISQVGSSTPGQGLVAVIKARLDV